MTHQFLRTFLLSLLLIPLGLFITSFFNFFQPFKAVYPPVSFYKIIPAKNGENTFVKASPGSHYARNKVSAFFLGKHYRFLWLTPVKHPVFTLSENGLRILRKGGGMQTTSFTLKHKNGSEFIIRSVDKDPVAVLPQFCRHTILVPFVRDQISATDPYASLVVGRLAQEINIYQTKPQLVYILPQDPDFKKYPNARGFFMLYPKQVYNRANLKPGENYRGSFSTDKLLNLKQSAGNKITLDTLMYLKCRLFDLLISDWDRHPGQWDWLAFSNGNTTVFRPAPKDRDQALGYYKDGVLPWLLSQKFAVRKITSFDYEYEDFEGFMQNGLVLDRLLLGKIPERQFIETAKFLQRNLSDKIINEAVQEYPPEVYPEIAPRIKAIMQTRRDKLVLAAKEFYKALHR